MTSDFTHGHSDFTHGHTAVELDLSRHLHERLIQVIKDHADTANRIGISRRRAMLLATATVMDVTIGAMLGARLTDTDIAEIISQRAKLMRGHVMKRKNQTNNG